MEAINCFISDNGLLDEQYLLVRFSPQSYILFYNSDSLGKVNYESFLNFGLLESPIPKGYSTEDFLKLKKGVEGW